MNAAHAPAQFKTRKTNVAEVRALIEAGLMDHQDPYELIDGVLYEMASEGFDHGEMKNRIAEWLYDNLDRGAHRVFVDTTLYLDEQNAPEPGIYVFPRGIDMRELQPKDVLLVIEIADSSLAKDQQVKAPLYARFGIQEYWIFDLETQDILAYRPAGDGVYKEAERIPAGGTVVCGAIPGVSFSTADLETLR